MRISIRRAGSMGHARCAAIAPDLFPLDDDGYVATDGFVVPEGCEVMAKRGSLGLP